MDDKTSPQTQAALRFSEEKFSKAFRISPDSININRIVDGMYIEVNEAFTLLTGYTAEEVIGKTSFEINFWVNPQDRSRLMQILDERGEIDNLELSFRNKFGNTKICLMSSRILDINGEKFILSVARDITERKLLEKEYSTFIQMSFDGFWSSDRTAHFSDVNDALCQILGYTREELLGMSIADIEISEKPEEVAAHIQKIIQTGRDRFQTRHRRKDGTVIDVEISVQYIGAPVDRFYSFIHDITERKHAEEEILRNKEALDRQMGLFNSLLKNLPIGVFMVEAPSGKPLLANEAAFRLLGRGILPDTTKENLAEVYEAYKLSTNTRYPPDEMPIVLGMLGKSAFVDDMLVVRPDKTETLVEVIGTPVTDPDGKVWASLVCFQDISQRKRAEQELRNSEERLRMAQEAANSGSWEWNLLTNKNTWSENLWHLYGLEPNFCEPTFETWLQSIHPDDRSGVARVVQLAAASGTELNAEWRVYLPDGSERWLMSRGKPFQGANGQVTRYAGVVIDITERKQAENKHKAQLEELRRWHAITLGREKRIRELKGEVNELLQKSGLPARYASALENSDA